jgi:hypothetical protein
VSLEFIFSKEDIEQGIVEKTVNSFGCSLKVENRSKYAVDVYNGTVLKDRIPPSSFLYIPNGEYKLSVNKEIVSKNEEPFSYVSVQRIDGQVKNEMGSTNFSGSMEINGDVNISNSEISVVVQNDLNANITNSELNVSGTVEISNAELNVTGNVMIENETLNAVILNSELNVKGSVEISNDTINANIQNAEIKTDVINNSLSINPVIVLYEQEEIVVPTQNIISFNLKNSNFISTKGIFDSFSIEIETIGKDINGNSFYYDFVNIVSDMEGAFFGDVPTQQTITFGEVRKITLQNGITKYRIIASIPKEEVLDDIRMEMFLNPILLSGSGGGNTASIKLKVYAFNSEQTKTEISKPVQVFFNSETPPSVIVQNKEESRTGQLLEGTRTIGEYNTNYINKPKGAKGILIHTKLLDRNANMTSLLVQVFSRVGVGLPQIISASYSDIPIVSSTTNYTSIILHEQGDGIANSTATPPMYHKKVILPNEFAIRFFKGVTGGYNYDYTIYYEWLF